VTPTERKHNSEERLASLGIVLIDVLPPIEDDDVNFKTPQQIATRILIFSYLNCIAFDPSLRDEVMIFLIREKLWDETSAQEKALFHKPKFSEREAAQIQWRAESIWLMLWAINKVETLELPSNEAQPEAIFPLLPGFFEPTAEFIEGAYSRSAAEILDEADFTFRLNWGFHEARGREQTIPGMNEFVAYERYVSLNWITGVVDQWEDE